MVFSCNMVFLYLFAMISSMNQVIRPLSGDHDIQQKHGIFVFVYDGKKMKQVIRPQAGYHGIQLQHGILYFLRWQAA